MMKYGLGFVVFALCATPFFAHAQFINIPPKIELSVNPRYPGPGEEVTVTAQSQSIDLTFSTLSWYVGGVKTYEGIGLRQIELVLGSVGSQTNIRVVARSANGAVGEESVVLQPNAVDLIWEADSYTPWMYKGKALLPPQGVSRIVAIPYISQGGQRLSNDSLHFLWRFNGRAMGERSGFGRDVFENDRSARENTITVEVSDRSGITRAVESIVVPRTQPQVFLYQEHPAYGTIFQNTLQNRVSVRETDFTMTSFPFFFSSDSIFDPELLIEWRVGGREMFSQNKHSINVAGNPGSRGNVEATIRHTGLRQNANKRIFVEFVN